MYKIFMTIVMNNVHPLHVTAWCVMNQYPIPELLDVTWTLSVVAYGH